MGRASAILAALALLCPVRGAHAECLSDQGEIECGGVAFSVGTSELHDDGVHATDVLAVLPNGRVLQAARLSSECEGTCMLEEVTLSGETRLHQTARVDADGITAEGNSLAAFGAPPAPGIAATEFRWADQTATVGVGVLVPANHTRALTSLVAAGPDSVAMSVGLLTAAETSTRVDVARVYGDTAFLVSGAERLEVGPLRLSLDGTLGNSEGRAFHAGSQNHFGPGREELVVELSAGDSDGLFALRYIAARETSGRADGVELDGVVTGSFGVADATLEIGAGARRKSSAFEPSLGTALSIELPASGRRWTIIPRSSVRVVGERSEALRDAAEGRDTAGLSGGVFTEVVPIRTGQLELRLVADGAYGAVLSAGQAEFEAWNAPIDGWRATGGLEVRTGRHSQLRWLAERAQSDSTGFHTVTLNHFGQAGWASGQVRLDRGGYSGAWAMAGAGTDSLRARFVAVHGEAEGAGRSPILGRRTLRRADRSFVSPASFAMGLQYRTRMLVLEGESTYSSATTRGPRFGGFGHASVLMREKAWGINALVGTLVGSGEVQASVGLHLGDHPGVTGWHRR